MMGKVSLGGKRGKFFGWKHQLLWPRKPGSRAGQTLRFGCARALFVFFALNSSLAFNSAVVFMTLAL